MCYCQQGQRLHPFPAELVSLPSLLPNQEDTGLSTANFSKESLDTGKGDPEDNSLIVCDFFNQTNVIQPLTGTAGGVCSSRSGLPLSSGRRSRIFHGVSHLISVRPLHEDETNCVSEMPTSLLFPEAANSAVNVHFWCLLPICSQTQMISKKIGIFLSLSFLSLI